MNNLLYMLSNYFSEAKMSEQNWYNRMEKEIPAGYMDKQDVILEKPEIIIKPVIFSNPKPGFRITSKFGNRTLTINGKPQMSKHSGIDFGGGGDCFAVEDSVIEKIVLPDYKYPSVFKWINNKGWVTANIPAGRGWTPYVSIIGKHTGNRYTYRHTECKLKVGDHVDSNDILCVAGQWGYCMGAHLHFDMQEFISGKFGSFIDPSKFLEGKGLTFIYK